MPRCSFCKQNYEFPRGLTLILNDGNILYFCSKKCRLNQLKLRRDSKKVNWVRKAEASEATEAHLHVLKEKPSEVKKEARPVKDEQKTPEKSAEKKEETKA